MQVSTQSERWTCIPANLESFELQFTTPGAGDSTDHIPSDPRLLSLGNQLEETLRLRRAYSNQLLHRLVVPSCLASTAGAILRPFTTELVKTECPCHRLEEIQQRFAALRSQRDISEALQGVTLDSH